MSTTQIITAIEITHALRLQTAALREKVQTLRAKFEASIADLVRDAADAAMAALESEDNLRALALGHWRENPENRFVGPGVEVKLFTVTAYDPERAFVWALEHGLCLSLDKRAFESLAKADATRPGFVTVTKEPRVLLAGNLDCAP